MFLIVYVQHVSKYELLHILDKRIYNVVLQFTSIYLKMIIKTIRCPELHSKPINCTDKETNRGIIKWNGCADMFLKFTTVTIH